MNVSDSCAYMCHLRVHAHIPNLCMCVHVFTYGHCAYVLGVYVHTYVHVF